MTTYLQNIYEFNKLLVVDGDLMREIERRDLGAGGDGAGPYFVGHYVPLEGRFFGVRPSPTGPVYFDGDGEVGLLSGRHRAEVERTEGLVVARLYDGDTLVREVRYTPDLVLEFDPYEGTASGLFDWLAEQLASPGFFDRLRTPS